MRARQNCSESGLVLSGNAMASVRFEEVHKYDHDNSTFYFLDMINDPCLVPWYMWLAILSAEYTCFFFLRAFQLL